MEAVIVSAALGLLALVEIWYRLPLDVADDTPGASDAPLTEDDPDHILPPPAR